MVHAVEFNFQTIYKPMRIHGNNATRYGNAGKDRLPPIDRMTVSPDTYCDARRLLGKILFVNVLPISGSCQSMVYRSVTK